MFKWKRGKNLSLIKWSINFHPPPPENIHAHTLTLAISLDRSLMDLELRSSSQTMFGKCSRLTFIVHYRWKSREQDDDTSIELDFVSALMMTATTTIMSPI